MLRRDFVRTVISVSLAPKLLLSQQRATDAPPPPAPVPWTLGLNPKTPLPVTAVDDEIAETEGSFFTQAQMGTFARLCNVLLPPIGNRPGAVQAGTPLFLDFLIGSSPEPRRRVYTSGLDWLEGESQRQYKVPFARLSDAQADALLKPWLRTWMTDHPPTEHHADFINIAREDIRTATVNSKVWSDAAPAAEEDWVTGGLYWSPIEPDVYCESSACARRPATVIAAPKAAHTFPSYPR
jgi:Gluconate 2-dehydrogenase subunit 3